ncbi:MAG TPA: MlaD family protein [Candidatus Xenobia bacterium]|nr:MlaD family protein [Candidatus Xenobia bacterium]
MRTSRQISWSELRVGLFVIMALGMASVFVFYMTQAGSLFAREVTYVTYLPDGAGLEKGAPVRLVGFGVGTVEEVGLSEFREDPTRHAKVVFRVRREYAGDIRSDSQAFVTTEGLLGQSVLELTRGMKGEPVAAGGEVPGATRGSMKQVVENAERLTAELRLLVADIRKDPKKYLNAKISLF